MEMLFLNIEIFFFLLRLFTVPLLKPDETDVISAQRVDSVQVKQAKL